VAGKRCNIRRKGKPYIGTGAVGERRKLPGASSRVAFHFRGERRRPGTQKKGNLPRKGGEGTRKK